MSEILDAPRSHLLAYYQVSAVTTAMAEVSESSPLETREGSQTIALSILLPVRNEGINLRIMVKLLQAVVDVPYELLVVFDFDEDDSIPVIRDMQDAYRSLRLVHNRLGRGVINAIRAGVEAAKGDSVMIFAADEVGPVLAIEDMLQLMNEGCDLVSCSRYAHGGRRLGGSMVGGLLSRLANWLFGRLAGCVLTDATTGIKVFRRSLFSSLNLEANPVGWAVAFEMSMKAQLANWTLGEVPIVSIDRLYGGASTFRLGPWTREYFRWFLWGWRNLRRVPRSKRPVVRIRHASAFPGGDREKPEWRRLFS